MAHGLRVKNSPAARLRFWARVKGADIWTLLALLLAGLARAKCHHLGGVWLVYGGQVPWLLQHHPLGPMQAMAVGRVIFAPNKALLHRHLRHEWAHVRQFVRFGLVFPLLYFLELLRQALRAKSPYFHNIFEQEARQNECRAQRQQN